MKKFISILILGLLASLAIAQTPVASKITNFAVTEGKYTAYNSNYADTLPKNDTLFFIFQVTHENTVAFSDQSEFKLVASDTTVVISYWQSNDKVTWYAVNAGTSPSAYTKSITATATGGAMYDSKQDVVYFNARYLGKRYISKNKTGFKTIPKGYLKTCIGY